MNKIAIRHILPITLCALTLFTSSSCINDDKETETSTLTNGDSVPTFSVTMNDGETFSTANVSTALLITFFNTTCPDCQQELPVIQEVYDTYSNNQNIQFICISREQNAEDIQDYWINNSLTLPFSAQEDRTIYNLFATSIIPRIYIIDNSGIIQANYDDSPLATATQLTNNIEKVLSKTEYSPK